MGKLAGLAANIIPTAPEQFRGPTPTAPEMSRPGFGFGGGGVAGPQPGFGSGFNTIGNDYGAGSNRPIPGYSQPGFVPSIPIVPPGVGQTGFVPSMPIVDRGMAAPIGSAPAFGSGQPGFGSAPSFGGGTVYAQGNSGQLNNMMGAFNNPGYQQSIMSLFNSLFGGSNTYMR